MSRSGCRNTVHAWWLALLVLTVPRFAPAPPVDLPLMFCGGGYGAVVLDPPAHPHDPTRDHERFLLDLALPGETRFDPDWTDGFVDYRRLSRVAMVNGREREISWLEYRYNDARDSLYIGYMGTLEEPGASFRGRGLSTLLAHEALARHPETRVVSARLGKVNYRVFMEVFEETGDREAAIRSTPFYKSFSQLGFPEIRPGSVDIDVEHQSVGIELVP